MRVPGGSLTDVDDRELNRLLYRAAHGDEEAFTRLYDHTASRIYPVCMHLLGQREAAEEALQEAFVRIWHQASTYSAHRGGVLTWMISIARYRAIDQLRHRGRRPETDLDDAPAVALTDHAPGPQEYSAMATDAAALSRCLDTLTAKQREAIQLAFLQGLSHDEVCGRLGRPLGSIKSWIRRGLQSLKQCLQR